ncbi:MAG: glycosyltransferase family 4 protein [candidate division WOR-3 bacterium]
MTSSHPVDYSRFFHREAVSLARAGYDVSLIGLESGSKQRPRKGVSVFAVPRLRGIAKSRTLALIRRLAEEQAAAVYHCLDPWTLELGLTIARRHPGTRIVYDSTELYPAVYAERDDLLAPVRWLLALRVKYLEREALRRADAIIETNATRARRFADQGREPVLVPNYPALDSVPEPATRRKPWLAYTGMVTRHRGFDKLLEAFAKVVAEFPDARLRVVGNFDPHSDIERWAKSFVAQTGIAGQVEFLGWLPYEQMFLTIRESSVGIILLQPGRTNDYTGQPNKLFEFMAMGIPVVASDFPEIAAVVRSAGCGWLVDPTNVNKIAHVLRAVLGSPERAQAAGRAGRQAVLERYNWAEAEKNLVGLYRCLMA